MSTRLIASTIMSAVLVVVALFLVLSGCESSSTEPNEPIQYPNEETTQAPGERTTSNYEKTTSNYEVQYPNELPDTSGVKLW